jgi:hypothetical protein
MERFCDLVVKHSARAIRRRDDGSRQKTDNHASGTYGFNARHDRCVIKAVDREGHHTDEEFKKKLGEERATYQRILKSIEQ